MTRLLPGATLVLGGARSGKSRHAETLVNESGLNPIYLATGQALDTEMGERIEAHRKRRGPGWRTIEEPIDLAGVLAREPAAGNAVLVDCLTMWISNLMMADADFTMESGKLLSTIDNLAGPVVFVSNEVGLGIVPDNAAARRFRDLSGELNARIAQRASAVQFVAAGLALSLK